MRSSSRRAVLLLAVVGCVLASDGAASAYAPTQWGIWNQVTDKNESYPGVSDGLDTFNIIERFRYSMALRGRAVDRARYIVLIDTIDLEDGQRDRRRFDAFLGDDRFRDRIVTIGGCSSGQQRRPTAEPCNPHDPGYYRRKIEQIRNYLIASDYAAGRSYATYWAPMNEPDIPRSSPKFTETEAANFFGVWKSYCPGCKVLAGEFGSIANGANATYVTNYLNALSGKGTPTAFTFHLYGIGIDSGQFGYQTSLWRQRYRDAGLPEPPQGFWMDEGGVRLDHGKDAGCTVWTGPNGGKIIPVPGAQTADGAYAEQIRASELLLQDAQGQGFYAPPERTYYSHPSRTKTLDDGTCGAVLGQFDSGLAAETPRDSNGDRPVFCILAGGNGLSCYASTQYHIYPRGDGLNK